MTISVHDVPEKIDRMELEAILKSIPAWRLEYALSYRFDIDRYLCARSFTMLREILSSGYGICDCPGFEIATGGKPSLKGHPEIHFNISHCRKGIICAVGPSPVGCDIEEIESRYDADIARRCFNAAEIAEIESSSDPCTAFTAMWTRKEAFLKLSGHGIDDDLPALLADGRASTVSFETTVCSGKGFAYTVCTSKR